MPHSIAEMASELGGDITGPPTPRNPQNSLEFLNGIRGMMPTRRRVTALPSEAKYSTQKRQNFKTVKLLK